MLIILLNFYTLMFLLADSLITVALDPKFQKCPQVLSDVMIRDIAI